MKLKNQTWIWTAAVLTSVLSTGCTAHEATPQVTQTVPPSVKEAVVTSPNKLFLEHESLQPVYFEAGKSSLDAKSVELLQTNLEWLKENLPAQIQVAGYSDGRGTPEQNLAVGQRRAAAVRDFYASMGIPRSRISTVSYGQEEPACFEATEQCEAKNRRVDTYIGIKTLAAH